MSRVYAGHPRLRGSHTIRPPAMGRAAGTATAITLADRIAACRNPEFAQWLRELWEEAARRDGNKLQYVYRRAMENMIAHPAAIEAAKDARRVPYVGPGIVQKLERRLEAFLKEGGVLAAAPAAGPAAAAAGAAAADGAPGLPASQPVPAPKPAGGTRRARAYVPAFRSGPYAMLIALHVESLRPDSKGYCTRQDILALGQPYCQVPMEEGTFSALRGAIKKLEEKGLVVRSGMPPRYELSDEGHEMALRLWNSGERRSSAPPLDGLAELRAAAPARPPSADPDSAGEGDAPAPPEAEQQVLTFCWEPGSYDLRLLVDNREIKSRTERDYLVDQLAAAGIPVEQRSLDLGDFLWVARKRPAARTGTHDDLEEAVMDLVIERKTEDDLLHSIADGRFVEQKFRLNASGIANRIYLLERYEGVDVSAIGEAKFRAAIVHTQVVDNLFLRYTAGLEDSLRFILAVHQDLLARHQDRPLHLALHPDAAAVRRAPFLAVLHRKSQEDGCRYLMSFACYAAINSKSGSLTLRDLFLRQLMAIRHMSAEKAALIVEQFPTPLALFEHFQALPSAQARREYFKDWLPANQVRKFGSVLSQRIYETFCDNS